MLRKIEMFFLSLAVLALIVSAYPLGAETRLCIYHNLFGDRYEYRCVGEETGIIEKRFNTYEEMHDFYTPQLKEFVVIGGPTGTFITTASNMENTEGLVYRYQKGK